MSARIEHQVIERDGAPLFVLVPYEEYLELIEGRPDDEVLLPHAVAKATVKNNIGLIRAWREYKGLTQQEVAYAMGISQSAYAQMESMAANPRVSTLKKIARALEVEWEQLRD